MSTPQQIGGDLEAAQHQKQDNFHVRTRSADSQTTDGGIAKPTAGVAKMEAMTHAWTPFSLWLAYIGIFLIAVIYSLDQNTTWNYQYYAYSSFGAHSLITTISVVGQIIAPVGKPVIAKIADVFGRPQALALSVFFYCIGYIQIAASQNVATYASSQVFYAIGSMGIMILQQIIIADTSNLLWRAFLSVLPDIPFFWSWKAGPALAQRMLGNDFLNGWRWGYGMFIILMPVVALVLLMAMFVNQHKAKKMGLVQTSGLKEKGVKNTAKNLFVELDVIGTSLLTGGLLMFLLPIVLAAGSANKWKSAKIICLIVFGVISLILFAIWEVKFAKYPIFPAYIFKNRTMLGAIGIGFFYFMAYYVHWNYLYTWLVVAHYESTDSAGTISNSFSFTSTAVALLCGLAIRYTGRYKWYGFAGVPIYILGLGLMIHFRGPHSSDALIVMTQVISGLGAGFINITAQLAVQASVTHQQVAAATAVYLTFVSIGGAIGSAIAGGIWTNMIYDRLYEHLPLPHNATEIATIVGSAYSATAYPAGSAMRDGIIAAYSDIIRALAITSVCLAIPILFFYAFCLENFDLRDITRRAEETGKHANSRDADVVAAH
ncbi:hypothetical protein YB2330_001593 [Saitoella coloradoensis]